MNRQLKFLSVIIIFNIIFSICISFFNYTTNAVNQSVSSDINSLDDSLYPGIKSMINSLKSTHPNWNFKILYTDIEWEDAIKYEYMGHGGSPKNLVSAGNSKYAGSWICPICKDGQYDTGSWVCASESAIKYMMDPRNSLNSNDIFQFMELSYDNSYSYDRNVLKSVLSGSFLDNDTYIDVILDACKTYNTNPYYIVARILQEQKKQGTVLTSGNGYNGQYVGVYNIFNIGASGNTNEAVILNGLKKASDYGWTSLELALRGGIQIIADKYIAVGQNTMYLQKFDVDNSDGQIFWHQYMQNILAAQNEGTSLRGTLETKGALEYGYTFIIPVYKNMPATAWSRPSTTTSSSIIESDVVRVNVSEKISLRDSPNGTRLSSYLYAGEYITRLERASKKVAGTYWDKVIKSNGTQGYVARTTDDYESEFKQYLIQLNNDDDYSGNKKPNTPTENPSTEYKKGDVNNDGKISPSDYVLIKNHIIGTNLLSSEEAKKAADVNNDGKISPSDYVLVKNYIVSGTEF